jgi:oligopeptide transport system permease protein
MAWIMLRKLLYTCMALLIVTTLTFLLMKAAPGDPFQQEQALPTEIYQALRSHYGLNDHWLLQYGRHLRSLVTLDLGSSLIYKGSHVATIIKEGFPLSALLGGTALIFAIPMGICLGMLAALKQSQWPDALVMFCATVGISVPSYILATLLQYIFGIKLGIFPIARWGSFVHVILPALSLAAPPAAFIARMTRAKLINEFQQGYITTAFAKGLSQFRVLFSHALRNILVPILSYIGPLSANILTGSFIIEKIYSIPGLGYWFVSAVQNRDYPLIMGITFFYCVILLFSACAADFACLFIDPRLAATAKRQEVTS